MPRLSRIPPLWILNGELQSETPMREWRKQLRRDRERERDFLGSYLSYMSFVHWRDMGNFLLSNGGTNTKRDKWKEKVAPAEAAGVWWKSHTMTTGKVFPPVHHRGRDPGGLIPKKTICYYKIK